MSKDFVFIENGLVKYEDYSRLIDKCEKTLKDNRIKDKEIERLQHNQKVSTKWEIKLTQKNTKLKEESKRLKSIIKEVREYIQDRYDGEVLTYTFDKDNVKELLEILDKVEEKK